MQFGRAAVQIQNKIHTMKMTKTKLAKGFTLVELLVVIAIIAALAALSTPVVLKQQKKAAATEAVNNAKQHFILLFEFDQDNGAYPGAAATMTSAAVAASSNEVFREFFISSQIDSEDIFFCKNGLTTKPDGDIGTAATVYANAVAVNEVGFHYLLKDAANGHSTASPSGVPLEITPCDALTPTAASPFNLAPFGGRAIVLFNDGACKSLPITEGATAGKGLVNINAISILAAAYPPNATVAPVVLPTL